MAAERRREAARRDGVTTARAFWALRVAKGYDIRCNRTRERG
jgi:hypothetical protein